MPRVKHIALGRHARLQIKQGIDLVATIVKGTLGPHARYVAFSRLGPLPPRVVNDGTTIADEISTLDPHVNDGVRMMQEIAKKTNDNAGDGTTTTILLAQAMVAKGFQQLRWHNPVALKDALEADVRRVIDQLHQWTIPIVADSPAVTYQNIKNVATIAANNDEEVGTTIADITQQVGMSASIMVEKSSESKIRTEVVKGIWFEKGWTAPAFVNVIGEMKAVHQDVPIIITDQKIQWLSEIDELFTKLAQAKVERVVLIADSIEGEALQSMAVTHKESMLGRVKPGMQILGIEAPEFGPTRKEILEDMCVMTGATLISGDTGLTLTTADPMQVAGKCKKIVSDSKSTVIVGGAGNPEEIKKRIEGLKDHISQLKVMEKITREKLEKRLRVMESGVGIIYAGGPSEVEARDRYLRLEDAILATRSAIKNGIVPGGGHTYWRLGQEVAKSTIMRHALNVVVRQIAINAGENPNVIERALTPEDGWNAKTKKFGNLFEAGIVDATLVVEEAIKNAASLAMYVITMDALITEAIMGEGGPEQGGKKPPFKPYHQAI